MSRRRSLNYPDKPGRRNYADEVERREVAEILSELPEDHPARFAWEKDDRTTVDVSHILRDRRDLVERLTAAYMAGLARVPGNSGSPIRGGLDVALLKDPQSAFACPTCGGREYAPVYVKDRAGNERMTQAFQCERCTVMFRDPEKFSIKRPQ